MTVSYISVDKNSALREGGAVYIVTDSTFDFSFSSFSKNSAKDASAIYANTLDPELLFKIRNCLFNDNKAA